MKSKKLTIGNLYDIEGELFILCKSIFEHCTNDTPVKRYYFKKLKIEDAIKLNLMKKAKDCKEENKDDTKRRNI